MSLRPSESDRISAWRAKHGIPDALSQDTSGSDVIMSRSPSADRLKLADWDGSSHRIELKGKDAEYGTPEAGSKTDIRGRKAAATVSKEMVELCEIIVRMGQVQPDNSFMARFGVLFDLYTKISNKLVGMLIRARKHGLIQFEGEMLYQGRDNQVPVYLVQVPAQLQELALARFEGLPATRS